MHSLHHHNCIKETKSKSRQQITHDYYHHHQYQTPAIFRLLPATTTATCFSAINSLWNISTSNPRDRHGQQQQQLVDLRSLEELRCHGRDFAAATLQLCMIHQVVGMSTTELLH